jgi:phosphonate transport system substrate-binding protein
MHKSAAGFVMMLVVLIMTCGCDRAAKEEATEAQPDAQAFVLGLIPEQDLFSQKKRYESLAGYVSRRAGVTIELKILSRYGNIIDNFVSEKLDGAFFGSFTGALAIKKLGITPVARPEWQDGTSTYYGMIFVRKDSSIKNVQDMRGKRFAMVDKATTAGWLLPLHYLEENNVKNPMDSFLRECYFTGTHEDAIRDVLDGRADIGAAKNTVYYRLAEQDRRILDELQILAESPRVPANSLGVGKNISESLRLRLKKILLEMSDDTEGRTILENFGARRFVETTRSDYDPVFQYAEHVGIDMSTYDYLNN